VYTVISVHRGVGLMCRYRFAGWCVSLVGSVNIRKHSARVSLQVMDGSNMISSFSCLALSFRSFLDLVRDRPSGGSCVIGLCLGGMRFSLVSASVSQS